MADVIGLFIGGAVAQLGPSMSQVAKRSIYALVRFYKALSSLAQELKSPPITVLDGGFDDIIKGLDMLRAGSVSGSKLVAKLKNQ